MSYTGKMFEQDFLEDAKNFLKSALVTRLHDTTNGFKGVANPCDFIAATKFGTVFIELKTTVEASLSFNNVTDYQWSKLVEAEKCNYSLGGILVYFQKYEEVRWYPLSHLEPLRISGAKSVNPQKLPELGYIVQFRKKRTRITIPFKSVLQAIENHSKEVRDGKTSSPED